MALFTPLDGRITSQNTLLGPLTGGEVQEIVSPGTAANGNTYQIALQTTAAFYAAWPTLNAEKILAGASLASPYQVLTTDTRILFNKTVGAASYAVLPLAASMIYGQEVLFKDIKGDAGTNAITVTFTGGEKCDGLTQVQITQPYGWFRVTPTPGGGSWYMSG